MRVAASLYQCHRNLLNPNLASDQMSVWLERFRSGLYCLMLLATVGCGASTATGPTPEPALQPPCAQPAQLLGAPDPAAPAYIVVFHGSVDATAETARLATTYSFQPRGVYTAALEAFSAELTREVVAELRCISTVDYIVHDQAITLGTP
jgi:hypothetical protein